MHEIFENAFFDQNDIFGPGAFVVDENRDRACFPQGRMGEIDERDERAGDRLPQVIAGDRSTEYQVGLCGVTYGLMGEATGDIRGHDAFLDSGAGEHGLLLLHEVLVHRIDSAEEFGGGGEKILELPESADHKFMRFDRVSVLFGAEHDNEVHLWCHGEERGPGGGDHRFLHIQAPDPRIPARQRWIFLIDIGIHFLEETDLFFLAEPRFPGREIILGRGPYMGERFGRFLDSGIEKQGIFRRLFNDGLYCLMTHFGAGRKAPGAVFENPRRNPTGGPLFVSHEVSLEQVDSRLPVFLHSEFGVLLEKRSVGTQIFRYHGVSSWGMEGDTLGFLDGNDLITGFAGQVDSGPKGAKIGRGNQAKSRPQQIRSSRRKHDGG